MTLTHTVSFLLAYPSAGHLTIDITLVQALDLFRLVLQEDDGLDTYAISTSNPELTIYRETVWSSQL